MKINMLLILAATIGVLGVAGPAVANPTNNTPGDHLMSDQLMTGKENGNSNTKDDSQATWGLHEPIKNCVTCHEKQPENDSPDTPALLASVPQLCYGCHKDHLTPAGWVHGPVATGNCMLCHEPHKTNEKSLLRKSIPELCHQCHESGMLQSVANHTDESYEHCNACHDGHTSPGRMLLKQNILKSDAVSDYINKYPPRQRQSTVVDQCSSLSGLHGVKVVAVVEKPELFKRYKLTEDAVRTKVEMQLRRNGIRIIGPNEQIVRPSCLYVYLRLMEVPSQHRLEQAGAVSGSLNISLRQKVELPGKPDDSKRRFCTATTWDTGSIVIWGTTQIEEGLGETIGVLVDKFSKDYMDANPMARASQPSRGEN